jgi:uncharacterized protein YbjT (DUF2867 family)
MGRIALVAGATGLVGSECLRILKEHPGYEQAIALSRRSLSDPHPRVTELVADFDHLDTIKELRADHVFCALGTTMRRAGAKESFRQVDFDYSLAVAKLGVRAGATQFVLVSADGADARSRVFYLRTKGELEEAVAHGEETATVYRGLHIFRPGLLLGERQESRPGEAAAIKLAPYFGPLLRGPFAKHRPIAAVELAKAMVAAALTGNQGRFTYHYSDIRRLAAEV